MCGALHTIIKHLLSMKNLSALIAPAPLRFEYGAGNHQSVTDYVDYVIGTACPARTFPDAVCEHAITYVLTRVVTCLAH